MICFSNCTRWGEKKNNPLVIWRAFACSPLECIVPYFGNKRLCLWAGVLLLQSQSARHWLGAHLPEPAEISKDLECSGNLTRKRDGEDASSALQTWPVYTCHFLCLWRLMIRKSLYVHARTLQCSSIQCATNKPAFKAGKDDQQSVFIECNREDPGSEAWVIACLLLMSQTSEGIQIFLLQSRGPILLQINMKNISFIYI